MKTTTPLPQDNLAEEALLGALLLAPEVIEETTTLLTPGDFYRKPNAQIYQAVLDLYRQGKAVDVVTLAAELERRGELGEVGGRAYLFKLTSSAPLAAHAPHYARIVADKAQRRRLLGFAAKLAKWAHEANDPLALARDEFKQFNRDGHGPGLETITAAELLALDLPPLRWLVEGLIVRPGFVVLAGQPKVGKSWFALQLAHAVALGKAFLERATESGPAVYVALEDGRARLQSRLKLAGWSDSEAVHFSFSMPPLDDGGLDALASTVYKLKPVLVIIDSLAAAKSANVDENAAGDIAELGLGLAALAQEADCTILAIHHHRKAKSGIPGLDLRGSSALYATVDALLSLYRERKEPEAKLMLDGRDVEPLELALGYTGSGWSYLGPGELVDQKRAGRETLAVLQELGEATTADIAKELGISHPAACNRLARLVDEGLVTFDEKSQGRGRPVRVYRPTPF